MELTYTKVGDYYIPDLALDDDTEYKIGVYGRMREKFLKEHHPGVYNRMVLFGELWKHLAEIDAACHERIDFLISVMAKQEGVTEASKASNQMEWVGCMNNIRNRAEEIVLRELGHLNLSVIDDSHLTYLFMVPRISGFNSGDKAAVNFLNNLVNPWEQP